LFLGQGVVQLCDPRPVDLGQIGIQDVLPGLQSQQFVFQGSCRDPFSDGVDDPP
jgi:hypothetical protein